MAGLMVDPEPRNCRVSFVDPKGLRHSVEVVAATRNEAAIRGLPPFTNAVLVIHPRGCLTTSFSSSSRSKSNRTRSRSRRRSAGYGDTDGLAT